MVNGINTVRQLLREDRLHINKRCVNSLQEFETYSYPDPRAGERMVEAPMKINDDMMDSIRYAVHSYVPTFGRVDPKPKPIRKHNKFTGY